MLESLSVGKADITDQSSSRHMYVHGQIENENVIALVDTGASGLAFVSRALSDRLILNPIPLSSPIALVS